MATEKEWVDTFKQETKHLADILKQDALDRSSSYGDAKRFINKISQLTHGDIDDQQVWAVSSITDAVCRLAKRSIRKEQDELPTKKEK